MTVDELILELEILTNQGYGDCLIFSMDFTWGYEGIGHPTVGKIDEQEDIQEYVMNHQQERKTNTKYYVNI